MCCAACQDSTHAMHATSLSCGGPSWGWPSIQLLEACIHVPARAARPAAGAARGGTRQSPLRVYAPDLLLPTPTLQTTVEDLDELSSLLQVPLVAGTVNRGSDVIGAGAVRGQAWRGGAGRGREGAGRVRSDPLRALGARGVGHRAQRSVQLYTSTGARGWSAPPPPPPPHPTHHHLHLASALTRGSCSAPLQVWWPTTGARSAVWTPRPRS